MNFDIPLNESQQTRRLFSKKVDEPAEFEQVFGKRDGMCMW